MKNISRIFPLMALALLSAIAILSCTEEKKTADTTRTKPRVDVPEDTVDSVPTTRDMVFADLTGPVQEVEWSFTFGEWVGDSVNTTGNKPHMSYTWKFDENGTISSIEGINNDNGDVMLCKMRIARRDDDGNPVTIAYDYTDPAKQPLYTKNEKIDWSTGLPTKRTVIEDNYSEINDFQFDQDGHYKHHEMVIRDGSEGYKSIEAYKYTKFDEQGNWTERYIRTTDMSVYFDENGNPTGYGDSDKFFTLERRKITYRE